MRAFYTTADGCCELKPDNFSKEEIQHGWVESNLQLLFPNLELVKRKLPIASKIPDTVAYDRVANTFVAIEYKNRRSDTVREQAEDYLNKMGDNRDTLVVTYNERSNVTTRTRDSFDWGKMYVVIIAPEFTERQVSVANRKDTECLYELKRFENGLVILRFVGGKHDPIDAVEQPKQTMEDATRESKVSNTGGNTHAGAFEAKNTFYAVMRDRILSAFPGMREAPTKHYVGFKRDGERLLCVAEVYRSKIAVTYGRKGDLSEDGFVDDVSNIGHHGVGDYRSYVSTKEHLERLLSVLAKVDGLSKGRR